MPSFSSNAGFIGIDWSGEERPYAWTDTGGVEDMASTYTVSRTYSGGSIASGQGVAASDNGAGFNFVRVWEGTDWTTIGCGEYCHDTSIGMSFGAAIGFCGSKSGNHPAREGNGFRVRGKGCVDRFDLVWMDAELALETKVARFAG